MQAGPDYAEGLINKMRTVIRRSPHQGDAGHKTSQSASSGQRLQRTLTGSPHPKPSGLRLPPGSVAVSSFFLNKRPAFLILTLLVALAVSLLFLLPGGLAQAQDANGPIEYTENGTGAVATFTAVDPEGESIVWSLATGDDMEDFDIENGVLTFMSSPDFENPQGGNGNNSNTYVVTVQASDGGDDTTATETVTVEVTNVEEPGTVMLSTLQPQVGVAITATLTDPDNIEADDLSSVTWQWYRGNSEIVGATDGTGELMSSYTPTTGDVGSVLRATAMYDDGEDDDKTAQEDSAHAVRQAPGSNIPPTFPDQNLDTDGVQTAQTRTVAENTPAGTNIGASVVASDPDVLTYSLDVTGAMSFDINRATGQLMTKVALNFEETPPDTVTVTATDPFGAEAMSVVTITATDVNEDPMVTGDASIDHAESNEATVAPLDADPAVYTGSDVDAADEDADLTWLLSGADASKFSIPETGATRTLSFKANPDYESPGDSGGDNVYEVTLVVTDSKGNSDEQDVTVKVTNIEEVGAITFSTLQPRVGFPVTATLTDPDNATEGSLEWQWYRGDTFAENDIPTTECANADSDDCLIKDATSGSYRPAAGDDGELLTAVATYTDGHANEEDAKDMVIARGDNNVLENTINQAPVFPDQDTELEGRQTAQERTVGENVPVEFGGVSATELVRNIGAPVVATDEDTVLTYSLGGPHAASFGILRNTGQLQTKAELDKETEDTYTVTVTAADSLSESSTITVTIKVTNVDEMPDLEGEAPEEYAENGMGAVATFTAEDPEGESITWSLAAGGDMEDFSIENGVLRFKSAPDYEAPADVGSNNMYEVTVQASDGGVGTTATEVLTIEVTNVDEPGTVMLSTLQPQVDVVIRATLDDPDRQNVNTITWQWYQGSSPITGATNGENSITSTYTPATGNVGSRLRARAMYDDDEGDDKTAQEDSANGVRRAPATNTDPVFPDRDLIAPGVQAQQTREVAENTPVGRNLGPRVAATDSGDVLTYSTSGADAALFDINRATGQLTTKAALDYENAGIRESTVTVTATDPFGATAMSVVTITVTDVNEDPTVMGAASIDHAENETVLDVDASNSNPDAAQYTATDEDGDDDAATGLTWLLSGADAGKFEITTTGATRTLSFENAPDFESPGDSGGNNVYEVTVKVTDSEGNSDEQDVTVKVTNVEEDGTVTLSTLQPRVAFPVTATLADPDNIVAGSVSWRWYKGDVTQQGLETLDVNECVEATTNNCFIKGAATATYTPVTNDVEDTLVAVALYTDGSPNEDNAKDFAMMVTAQPVLADTRNKAPVFPDRDAEMEGEQTDQERSVMENAPMIGIAEAIEGVRAVGLPVTAMDFITPNTGTPTPEILTYSLGGPDADSFSIDRRTAQISTKADVPLDTETKDTYTVTVTATDPSGLTETITVTITVTDVDEAPVIRKGQPNASPEFAGATADRMVAENTSAGENIGAPVAATDAEGDTLTYALVGPDAGSFDIDTATGQLMTKADLDYETKSSYMVTVTANDGEATALPSIDVTITVADVNEAPEFAGATAERMVAENTAAGENIDAPVAATDDDDDDTLTYGLRGPDAGSFGIDTAMGQLMTKAALDYEAKSGYMVTVTANDGEYTATIDVTITVTDVNEAPEFAGTTAERVVAENTAAGENIGAPVAATDADDTLAYVLGGPDASSFGIDTATGQLMTKSALDYGTKSSYMVTVTATDGEYTATIDVTITVTDVNEAPEFAGATADRMVAENTAAGENIGAPVTATDADADTLTYGLRGPDAGSFDIDTATGQLMTKAALDYETKSSYMVTVTATDGEYTATIDVAITVTDVNEAPEFAGATADRMVAESTAAGENIGAPVTATDADATLTYGLRGPDASSFGIDTATGQLMTKAALDYETKSSYMVTVTATDGEDTATIDVTITVTDVNEAPEFGATAQRVVAENTAAGENIGAPVEATDANDDTLTYGLRGPDAVSFDIDTAMGQLMTKAALDYETKSIYMVTVTANDGEDTATIDVTITVTDVNEAPEFASATAERMIAENTAAGENIDAPVAATDADDDTLTYALGGPDAGSFGIDTATGQLMTKSALDYGTKSSYMVTVTATDGEYTATIDVTITVTDVNEAPEFAGATAERVVAENTAAGENIGAPVTATDADPLTYVLGGPDASSFDIDTATGQLMTKAALDYETKSSYMVTVTANDGEDTASIDVAITVTDLTTGSVLGDTYDANEDGIIERAEAVNAVRDYFASPQIRTKVEALQVIALYFASRS